MTRSCCTLAEMIESDRATRHVGVMVAFRFRYRRDDLGERHISRVAVEVDEQKPGMGTIAFVQREEVVAVRGEDGPGSVEALSRSFACLFAYTTSAASAAAPLTDPR